MNIYLFFFNYLSYPYLSAPPKIETPVRSRYSVKREKKEALENSPVIFTCPFSGYPMPQFVWTKNGQILIPKADPFISISENGKILHVKYAKAHHSGDYVCIAKNEAGESREKFTLDVMGRCCFIFVLPLLLKKSFLYNVSVK